LAQAPTTERSAVPPDAPAPPRRRNRVGAVARLVAFPALVVAAFLALVALDLNGSSIANLGKPWDDSSVVAGDARWIRSDEWIIQTPNSVGNVRRGLPVEPWFGLVQVRQPVVTLGAPSKYWAETMRPQNWGYFFDDDRGLAWHWWFSFLAGLVGLYALLQVVLRRSVILSAALAVVGAMTPYSGWWSAPSTAMLLGYATGAAACAVLAMRTPRVVPSVAYAVGCGYLLGALAMTLYPPWQVSLGLVVAAVAIGQAIDHRVRPRRVALAAGVTALVAGVPLAVWYAQNRDAIATIAGTFYPGNRISEPGQALLSRLVNAPLNPWFAGDAGRTLKPPADASGYAIYTNLSEVSSSWFPLGVLLAAVVAVAGLGVTTLLRRRAAPEATAPEATAPEATPPDATTATEAETPAPVVTFGLVTAVTALLLGWALLPLPAWVGTVTVLNRVPPWRLPLAIGLGTLLVAALAGDLLRRHRLGWRGGVPVALLLVAGIAGTVWLTLWAERETLWNHPMLSQPLVAASGLAVAAGFAVVAGGRWQRVVAVLLAGYCAWSWALVTPLYEGLGPLDREPIVKAMRDVEEANPGTVAAVYGDSRLSSLVAASGVQSLSGVTFYPDEEVMQKLAPTQRGLWNNFASWEWIADPTRDPAFIVQKRGTWMQLFINPCAPETLSLGMTWTVSQKPIDVPCLRLVDHLSSSRLGELWRYQVVRAP
jgi:hypothetical protein